MGSFLLEALYTKIFLLAGHLSPNEELCTQLHLIMRFLALICVRTRLAYLAPTQMPTLRLALHQDLR